MPALDAILAEKITAIKAQHRLRQVTETTREDGLWVQRAGKRLLSFSCNDYLGLSHHPQVVAAAQEAAARYGAGAGASRLVTGNHPLYSTLEAALADWKQSEAACVFGSGYLANLGAISALVGRNDLVLADKLVHACILDGVRLSGAKLLRFAHNDAADCERLLKKHRIQHENCLIVTETVFSMDGDVAPLADLRSLCDAHDSWLMTDDAHGTGSSPNVADIRMGTLSKALGSYGGYVCGSQVLIDYLTTSARSLIFTTGLPPAAVGAAIEALRILRAEPQRAVTALAHARRFADAMGLPCAQSPIVPLLVGEESAALAMQQRLEEAGFLAGAIRPPTVPEGGSRLRFVFTSMHEDSHINDLIKVLNNESVSA